MRGDGPSTDETFSTQAEQPSDSSCSWMRRWPSTGSATAAAAASRSRRAVCSASTSGSIVRTNDRQVAAAVGIHWYGRPYATHQEMVCTVMVSATKVGRQGPRVVLNPAQPNENALSMICSAQQLELSKPSMLHHAILCAPCIICSVTKPWIASPTSYSGCTYTHSAANALITARLASSWRPNPGDVTRNELFLSAASSGAFAFPAAGDGDGEDDGCAARLAATPMVSPATLLCLLKIPCTAGTRALVLRYRYGGTAGYETSGCGGWLSPPALPGSNTFLER